MISLASVTSFLDLRILQRSFLLVSLAVFVFIPLDLFLLSFKAKAPTLSEAPAQGTNLLSSSSLETLSSYEQAFQKSTLFGLSTPEAPLPVFQSSIAELVKDYRLKGIVILEEPEAILEDARTQRSTFVRVGDRVEELTVKEIKEGAIVLSYYGEEKEMRIQ